MIEGVFSLIFILVFFALITTAVYKETFAGAVVALIVLFVFSAVLTPYNPLIFIKSLTLWEGIGIVVGYFVLGGLWSMYKVRYWSKSRAMQYKLTGNSSYSEQNTLNKVKEFACIAITFWPVSLTWHILGNWVMDISTFVYNRLGKFYQKIINSAYN
jgi:hypothetical protein